MYVVGLVGVVGYHVGLIRDRAWRETVISGGRQFDPGTGQRFFAFSILCESFLKFIHDQVSHIKEKKTAISMPLKYLSVFERVYKLQLE